MTALLHLGALPPRTTRGTLVRLLIQVGGVPKAKIGAIELRGREATIEVPQRSIDRIVKSLDGAPLAHHHVRAWRELAAVERGEEEDYFQRLIRLLELESDAEAEQIMRATTRLSAKDAERAGTTVCQLVVDDTELGLGGRTLVTLVRKDRSELPWTRLDAGSPVLLSSQEDSGSDAWRGVISERRARHVQVAFEQPPQDLTNGVCRLDLANDEVARNRMRTALQRAASAHDQRFCELRDLLVNGGDFCFEREDARENDAGEGEAQEEDDQEGNARNANVLDDSLNHIQREAVAFALAARDAAIIHGPPGTGKTTTVVELIRQAIRRGDRVLACAPSNLGVDNMLERLIRGGERVVRLGHPARVLPGLRDFTLDFLVRSHPDAKLAQKLVRQAATLRNKAGRYTRAKPLPGAKREMRDESRSLLDDARRLEHQAVQQIIENADVVCATTTGLDNRHLGERQFDLAVIDEACQTTEPGCWTVLLRCKRIVLAGDHCQLPPTVVSAEAAREGFGVSLLERLMDREGERLSRQLLVQYRMHERIMEFSSGEFYGESLVADNLVKQHLLADSEYPDRGLADVTPTELTCSPVHFIDTAGAGYDEQQEVDGASRFNLREAELVVRQVQALRDAGLEPTAMGVITPYSAQVRLLREQLRVGGIEGVERLEVDSVDGFQGREKEAIIISLVRSNPNGEIGFLRDTRRMNVALTRARRKLIVIGDSATIASHPFFQRLLEYFDQIGAYRTVWEYGA